MTRWFIAACLCFSAAARAHEPDTRVYTVQLPQDAAHVRWSPGASSNAGWDVSVSYDREACKIYCTYRRATPLADLLLPPVTILHVDAGTAAAPIDLLIDPAGLTLPGFAARTMVVPSGDCAPAARPAIARLELSGDRPVVAAAKPVPKLAFAPLRTTQLRI